MSTQIDYPRWWKPPTPEEKAALKLKCPPQLEHLLCDLRVIKSDGENPNEMSKREMQSTWRSLDHFGWKKVINVDQDAVLSDGEHRLQVCIEKEEWYAPILWGDLTDVDRRLFRQAANKISGTHNPDKDAAEYRRIVQGGSREELIKMIGVKEKELREALEVDKTGVDDPDKLERLEDVVTSITAGDRFQLGDHILMCGDSCKKEDVDKLLEGSKIDLICTDPPYGVYNDWDSSLRGRTETESGSVYNDNIPDYSKFSNDWVSALVPYLSDYNSAYVWINGVNIRQLHQALVDNGGNFHIDIIWVKNHFVLSNIDYKLMHENCLYGWFGKHKWYGPNNEKTVWEYKRPTRSEDHPTMKPVEMMVRSIMNSTMPSGTVVDLFGGSGSTLIACEQTDRRCYMMELEPRYVQIIINRWQRYTGKEATQID